MSETHEVGRKSERWEQATALRPHALVTAVLELHWAAQFIASAGQTFAEPKADDSHRAMLWNHGLRAFVGVAFAGPYPFRLALRPDDLTLLLLDREDGILGSFALGGHTLDEGYEWLALGMATYRGGNPPVIERPEYDMPDHPVRAGARFSTEQGPALDVLSALFGSAAAVLDTRFSTRDDASIVRCWPHHFDIATLITLEEADDAEKVRTVGVGLAPMGGGYDHWYWYVTPWPYPDPDRLPALTEGGAWHTEGWTGAVLTGDEVHSLEPGERGRRIERFLTEAVEQATDLLA
ncbi:MAG: hypothetical protein OEN56_05780 [Gemmatimonadota bacterium]|nr:hypothetical protein [Gemmatimonadota bacterium]